MRIGVVIPAYNRPRLAIETLESVAAQTRPADEVVLVDDCSTDDTAPCAEAWVAERKGETAWRVVRQDPNAGVCVARNRGASEIHDCELIAFLDSDDLWPEDMLARAEAALATNPGAVAALADRSIEDSLRNRPPRIERFDRLVRSPVSWTILHGVPTPSCLVLRRTAFDDVGGYDETVPYQEDLACFMHLAERGDIVHLPGKPIRYRLGVGDSTGQGKSMSHQFKDRGLIRANVVEKFHTESRNGLSRHLRAFVWFRAARSAYRAGRWDASRERAKRAMGCAPWYPRPAWVWVCASIRQLFDQRPAQMG
ncbi:MAG: glycosyltransferase family 2 protein [Planctomycetota bacterium]|jgi:glycosyltransferase involved in cell wall biosynthesis